MEDDEAGTHKNEDASNNDDTARGIALYGATTTTTTTEHDDDDAQRLGVLLFNLFRATLRTGDPDDAVTAFVTRLVGSGALEEGGMMMMCERIVLEEEAMLNEGEPTTTLQMIRLLGASSLRFDVFSFLIKIDHERWTQTNTTTTTTFPAAAAEEDDDDDDDYYDDAGTKKERWAARMAEIVRYLVEELHMPIRMSLLDLARDTGAWSAYCAFRQYCCCCGNQQQQGFTLVGLILDVLRNSPPGTVAYWARHFGIRTLSDDAVQYLVGLIISGVRRRTIDVFEAQAVLTAEIQLRTDERVHMRALMMMMQARGPARRVLESADIGRLIHKLAWEDALY